MKHGKKPTRAQKIFLKEKKLNPENWLVCSDTPERMIIEYRHTVGKYRTIMKN